MISIIDLRAGTENELYKRLSSRSKSIPDDILQAVDNIISNVKANGDKAVVDLTKKFDRVDVSELGLRVSEQEIESAYSKVPEQLLTTIRKAGGNIERFHTLQKEKSWFDAQGDGIILGQLFRPLEAVGIYVPGGTAPLISSVLMNAIPARVAGVSRIAMATPPGPEGGINPAILVAARESGVTEIYRMGGAQAIAALGYGTDSIMKVDKIVGPGNIFVAMAKKALYGVCDIDMIAGPSEILIIADTTADPRLVSADLLSQAEHDMLASAVLVTTSEKLAAEVQAELERQMQRLERRNIMRESIDKYGALVLVNDIAQAVRVANEIAPEHLELCVEEPFTLLGEVRNAGAIFLGAYSPEPLGDYFAGPNHVLPTSGTARFFSPLNVSDFIKKSSVISYTRSALSKVKDDIIRFAGAEGLTAHANAIKVRFDNEK